MAVFTVIVLQLISRSTREKDLKLNVGEVVRLKTQLLLSHVSPSIMVMKKHEQIIILEDNEISMFVTQGILASFEESYTINYFTNTEETMAFLKGLNIASGCAVSMFVNIGITLYNDEFIELAKKTVLSGPFRLFLLSSLPVAGEKKKQLQNAGFLCCIEKPLTEQKFELALGNLIP